MHRSVQLTVRRLRIPEGPGTYARLYDAELAMRDGLRSSFAVPIGVLTVVIGLLGAMFRSYGLGSTSRDVAFSWLIGVAVYLCLRSFYFLVRAYHGHEYETLPSPVKIRQPEAALRAWHAQNGTPAEATADFEAWLEDRYAHAAEY